MKKAIVLTAVLGVLAAPAYAGVDLVWDQCAGSGGVSDKSLLCSDGASNRLVASWQQPSTLTGNFVACDYFIDIQATTPTTPAFWDLQTPLSLTSCNFFYVIDKARPAGCTAENAWGFNGSAATVSIGYGPQFGGVPNRGRAVGSTFRSAASPVTVTGGLNYYLLHIDLFGDAEGNGCPGCTVPVAMVLNQVNSLSLSAATGVEDAPIAVTGPGLVGNCATSFGATATCAQVPVRNKTWGALKSLYR